MKKKAFRKVGLVLRAIVLLLVAGLLATNPEAAESSKPKQEAIKLKFETLRNWTYVEGKTTVPDSIQKLEGQKVEITGFMMPLTEIKDIEEFVLVPYLFGCCYGQPPALNHVLLVKMTEGHKTKFIQDVVQVKGTFHVGEMRQDGYLVSLYRVDCDEVAGE